MEPRPYQTEGIDFLSHARGAVLADDPGLGKTMQALLAARHLTPGQVLVVAPKGAAGVWQDEVQTWLGEEAGLYVGPGRKKSALQASVVVTNYKLMKEVAGHWPVVIFDEAHKLRNARRRNKGPGPFAAFRGLKADVAMFHLTGTPFFKSAADVWPLFNAIDPKRFGAYWPFANRWANVFNQQTPNGFVPVVEGVSDPEGFKSAFADVFLRRARENMPLTRQKLPLTMSAKQKKHYDELKKELVTIIEEGTDQERALLASGTLPQMTRLRQILVAPRMLGIDDDGALIEALKDGIETPAVIFTPFKQAVPYIFDALDSQVDHLYNITGDTRSPAAIAKLFNGQANPNRVLVSTIQMAESWSAHTAAVGYFAGFTWNPSTYEQAESRLNRPPRTDYPIMRYFTHRGTIDTHQIAILRKKVSLAQLLMSPVDLLEGIV